MKRHSNKTPFMCRSYEIKCDNIQVFYKALRSEKIYPRQMQEKNGTVYLTLSGIYDKQIKKICSDLGYICETKCEGDIIRAAKRLKKRPALIISLIIFGLAVIYLKNIVIRIDVMTDDEQIKSRVIHVLNEEGVKAGTYIPGITLVEVERSLKQKVEGISWAGITRKGNSLVIDVVKTIPKAEGSYSRFPTNLIASENATIDKVLVLDGKLMIGVGNGVKKGDIIVSGKIDIENPGKTNEKGEKDITTRYTRSMGTIEGTFHREVSFEQKLDGIVKKETGKIIKQRYLHLFSADIPLFFKDKTGNYYSDTTLSCPQINGYEIPVGIKTLELREYDHKPVRYSAKQAEELTMEKIKKYESNFLKGYKILEKKEEKIIEKDSVKIKVNYKLYGNICEEAAFFIKKQ